MTTPNVIIVAVNDSCSIDRTTYTGDSGPTRSMRDPDELSPGLVSPFASSD